MKRAKPEKKILLPKIFEHNLVPVLLLFIISFALYAPSLKFLYAGDDDLQIIRDNREFFKDPGNIIEAFKRDAYIMKNNSAFYRPLQTVSYIIDYQFSPRENDLSSFHISSLLIHFLTCFILYRALLKLKISKPISLFSAILFSVHPLFPQAVAWLPGRGDELAGLFSIAAFYMFLRYNESSKVLYVILHSIFYFMAVISKETTIFLPLAIVLYNNLTGEGKKDFRQYRVLIPLWGLAIGAFAILRTIGLGTQRPTPSSFGMHAMIQNLPVLPITFGKFFIPYDLTTYPLFKTYSIIIGTALIIVIGLLFYFSKGIRNLGLWGISWFLIFSVPPMYMRLSIAEKSIEYFEHRTYLPYIGLIILAAVVIDHFRTRIKPYYLTGVLASILLVFCFLTYNHEQDYGDRISFATSAVESNSHNGYARYQRGIAYIDAKRYEEALNDFNVSEDEGIITAQLYQSKGVAFYYLGRYAEAINNFSQALQYNSKLTDVYFARGMTFKLLGNYQAALNDFDTILNMNEKVYEILLQKGETYELMGEFEPATQCYNAVEKMHPNDPYATPKLLELQQKISGAHKE
jgi:tetratricopeptide (TPR) repeat protein